jgi:hypothetical protein
MERITLNQPAVRAGDGTMPERGERATRRPTVIAGSTFTTPVAGAASSQKGNLMPQSGAPLPNPPEVRRWTGAQSGRRVDPYKHPGKLVAPVLCPQCGAVYRAGRWQWAPRPTGAPEAICQACHRSNDNHPAGVVTLTGGFVGANRAEIVRIAEEHGTGEKRDRPANRIIGIEQGEDRVVVTTTDIQLPHRIGAAIVRAFQGRIKHDFDEADYVMRVNWHRDV